MLAKWVFFSLAVISNLQAQGQETSYDEKLAEIQWALTGFSPRALDSTITENYCGYNLKRFLGCIAGVEKFGQFIMPETEIQISGSQFVFVKSEDLQVFSPRELIKQRRARFGIFAENKSSQMIKSLVKLYLELRLQNPNPKPYQSALALNETFAVIYDPHHMYQPMFAYDGLNRIRQNPHIGIILKKVGNQVAIDHVYFGTEAEAAGLKAGDLILQADGKDLVVRSEEELKKALVFKPKQKVRLKISRSLRIFEVMVTFDYTNLLPVVDRKITFGKERFSFVNMREVPLFRNPATTCSGLSIALKKFEAETDGLILDLRGNVGGPGEVAACFTSLFVGKNKIMFIEQDMADMVNQPAQGTNELAFSKKLVVLVNAKTASSGELIAATLQFYGRGLILGDRTFGKSIGQAVQAFENENFDEYSTISKAYMPDGVSYQSKGVFPDFYVFRDGFSANSDERAMLREEDLALFPLQFENRQPMVSKPAPMVFPENCVNKERVKTRYESMKDTDWLKDFQLQFALETLTCL